MTILDYLFELLYTNDCVIIPGLGGFVSNYRPAGIHPTLHTFTPPSRDVLFNPRLTVNDGLLISYIAQKEGVSYEIASRRLMDELQQSMLQLDQGGDIEVANVGHLSRDAEGNLQFKPANTHNFLPASFGLASFISPAIVRERDAREVLLGSAGDEDKIRHLPVLAKRSLAIGIPAAAMIALAFVAIGPLEEWIPQTSNFLPWKSAPAAENSTTAATSRPTAKTFRADLFAFNPRIADTSAIPTLTTSASEGGYYLIGGCFSVEANAVNFVRGLQAEGFQQAGYFKQEGASLYKVYFSRHTGQEEAAQARQALRERHPEAWIFSM